MKNMGKYQIYLTESNKTVERNVFEERNGVARPHFIKLNGEMIEVKRSHGNGGCSYVTV